MMTIDNRLLLFFLIFILILGVFLSVHYSYISADAPYYLSVSRDISNGDIPYKDIYLSYTPIMMYLNTFIFEFFGGDVYKNFLIFQILIIVLSALVYYFSILKTFKLSSLTASSLALLLIISVLSSDGNYINLEVYSILFVFIAFFLLFQEKFILTGIFLALSFFCKQYGILNFIPFYVFLFLEKDKSFLKALYLSVGGLIPLALFLIYFVGFQEVAIMNLVQQLSGSEYIRYVVKGVPSLKAWFLGGKVFIVLVLLCFFIIRKKYKSHLNTVFVIGVFVNLIPTSIQSFQHYFINTFPYIFLLLAYNWEDAYRKRAFLVISVGALLISSLLFLRVIRYKGEYNHQLLIANSLQEYFPKNSTVFVYGKERYLYFLNNYDNPLKEKIGYSYLNNLPPYFLEGLKVISNKPFSDMKELFVLKKQKLYLKL